MIAKVTAMDKILEQALLYDFYGELLTEHQKEIYEQFVLDDLSLSEIAESEGISRQGVHDLVKRCQKALEGYEAKLHLVEKFLTVKKKVAQIDRVLEEWEREKEDPEEIIERPQNGFVRKFILNQLEIKKNNIYTLFSGQMQEQMQVC